MKSDSSIFFLVHSLDPAEKRFLKRLAKSSPEDEHYLNLFQLIEKQTEYDENAIRKQLAKKGIAKNFAWEKNYLTRQILRALRNYHTGPRAILEALDLLKSVDILYRKLQLNICMKMAVKGLQLARKYEFWSLQIDFIDWVYMINTRSGNYKELLNFEKDGKLEKEETIRRLALYTEVQKLIIRGEILVSNQSNYSRKEIEGFLAKAMVEVDELMKQAGDSFRIRDKLLHLRGAFYMLMHESEKDLQNFSEHIALFEKNPQFAQDSPFRYYAIRINYINSLDRNGNWKEALAEIEKLKTFVGQVHKSVSAEIGITAISGIMSNETNVLLALGEPKKALEAVKVYEKNRGRLKQHLNKKWLSSDNVHLARVYFRNGMFDKVKKLLKEVFDESKNTLNPDYLLSASLLRISAHGMMRNWDIIPHFADSTLRLIEKNHLNDPYAQRFLQLVKSLAKQDGKIPPKFSEEIERLEKLVTLNFYHYKDMQWFLEELRKK